MPRPIYVSAIACLLSILAAAPTAYSQATVSYQGFLYNQFGTPVQNGRIVAGTFKPEFNVSLYNYTYGDAVGNSDLNNYAEAVADGNFIPFDSGVLTGPLGVFSGTAMSSAAGSKVWFFGFPTSQTFPSDGTEVLASSTDPSFILPATGSISLNAGNANQFILGSHFNNGLRLSGLPLPEPTSGVLAAFAALILGARRARRGRIANPHLASP